MIMGDGARVSSEATGTKVEILLDPEAARALGEAIASGSGVVIEISGSQAATNEVNEIEASGIPGPELERKLDLSVGELFSMQAIESHDTTGLDSKSLATRTTRALAGYGVNTVRDVLVLGRSKVSKARNFAKLSREFLQVALDRIDVGIGWQNKPLGGTEAARICRNLSQVDSRVLYDNNKLYREYGVDLRNSVATVQEMLQWDPRGEAEPWWSPDAETALQHILGKAREYAEEFREERRRLVAESPSNGA